MHVGSLMILLLETESYQLLPPPWAFPKPTSKAKGDNYEILCHL